MNLHANPDEELDSRNPLVLTLEDVLAASECRALIERIEAAGPTAAPLTTAGGFVHRPDIRNNSRAMVYDLALAAMVYERVRPHVPARLEGEWHLCGANERLRCYRYEPGQYFAPHFDGAFARSRDERSLITLLVYLNDCEHGGETVLVDLEQRVAPRTGRALLFNHHLLHEGAPVKAGLKYVLRSDLMYRRAPPARG